jgi:hypothetical protein
MVTKLSCCALAWLFASVAVFGRSTVLRHMFTEPVPRFFVVAELEPLDSSVISPRQNSLVPIVGISTSHYLRHI